MRMQFAGFPAAVADQEDGHMTVLPVPTGYKRIQTLDLVGKAHFKKKIQRTINRWRFCRALVSQPSEQVVCLRWSVSLKQQRQHLPAQRREASSALLAKSLRLPEAVSQSFGRTGKMSMNHTRSFCCQQPMHKCLRLGGQGHMPCCRGILNVGLLVLPDEPVI